MSPRPEPSHSQADRFDRSRFRGVLTAPIGALLARAGATPAAATVAALLLALAAGGMAAAGWNIAGGIAVAAAWVADGAAEELARGRAAASRLGAVFDAVADRYGDAAVLAGMTVFATRFEGWPHPEAMGTLALGATLAAAYSVARVRASFGEEGGAAGAGPWRLLALGASREAWLPIAAVGTVAGECYWGLAALAAVAGIAIAGRLAAMRAQGIGTAT